MNQSTADILFEKFEILECLKKDSHASVYVANHIYLGKKIILKTLNSEELQDKTILGRFKREAKILARLDHPNLIKVLDFGTVNGNFYLSFEYFESRNLREVIKQNHLTFEEKTKLLIQLLRALNFAHQNETIHRDIKPENILINKDHDLKIADFGLAMVKSEQILTQKSSIVGTPSYMSPEQIRGEDLTPESDIFSAGIVAYELFTGINPFLGKDVGETINNILNFKEEKLFEKIEKLPDYLQPALKLMLRKSPKNRAKSAVEVLNVLGIEATVYNIPVQQKIKRNFKKLFIYSSISAFIILATVVVLLLNGSFSKSDVFSFPGFKDDSYTPEDQLNNSMIADEISDLNNKEVANESVVSDIPGKLFVEVLPWADVYINNRKIDTTPLKDYIQLTPGDYRIRLVHPGFPDVVKRVSVTSDKIHSLSVNLNDYVGYLDCKVNPWGDVYIDGELKGTTPLREPIVLSPGNHTLTIKNPEFRDIEERIRIKARDTLSFKYVFNE